MNLDSRMLTEASMKAQSMAEVFKFEHGDAATIARRFDGIATADEIHVFYDQNWKYSSPSDAYYRLICNIRQDNGLKKGDIRAYQGNKEIFSIIAMVKEVD
jgi:hypothetical protein